ncbi:unnamed protein product [Amoebophrya sp. A120]|nr:unnamed protein product [Amoebophrya sp. A120]|eukprot:GSA120T00019731001.1
MLILLRRNRFHRPLTVCEGELGGYARGRGEEFALHKNLYFDAKNSIYAVEHDEKRQERLGLYGKMFMKLHYSCSLIE